MCRGQMLSNRHNGDPPTPPTHIWRAHIQVQQPQGVPWVLVCAAVGGARTWAYTSGVAARLVVFTCCCIGSGPGAVKARWGYRRVAHHPHTLEHHASTWGPAVALPTTYHPCCVLPPPLHQATAAPRTTMLLVSTLLAVAAVQADTVQ